MVLTPPPLDGQVPLSADDRSDRERFGSPPVPPPVEPEPVLSTESGIVRAGPAQVQADLEQRMAAYAANQDPGAVKTLLRLARRNPQRAAQILDTVGF